MFALNIYASICACKNNKVIQCSLAVDAMSRDLLAVKVIPLKLFYYQTFFETWHNQHS